MTECRLHPLTPDTPINIAALPGLRPALWDRHDAVMPAGELLRLYEERWIYIDRGAMDANEEALLQRLVTDVGNGVFLD